MEASQRRVIAIACYLVAAILFVSYFGRPFWEWATWRESQGSLDLGFLKITTRPLFPSDAKSVIVGLIAPVLLAAAGRIVEGGRRG